MKHRNLIQNMPFEPNESVWGALLSACRVYQNTELDEHVAEHLFKLAPESSGYYVLLSNIYATANRWEDVEMVRKMLNGRGLKKTPGRCDIEFKNIVHSFLVGDRSHPQSEEIYAMLEKFESSKKAAGYVPDTDFVLGDSMKVGNTFGPNLAMKI